jgi:hypothetical protein
MSFTFAIETKINEELNIFFKNLVIKFPNIDEKVISLPANIFKPNTCLAVLKTGPNKGTKCNGKPIKAGYCSKHQKCVSVTLSTILDKRAEKNQGPENIIKKKQANGALTKTQLNILSMLNTAVPHEPTILKRIPQGLINEETDIVFDENFFVIGLLNKGKITTLGKTQVEICEKNGWKYNFNIVEL